MTGKLLHEVRPRETQGREAIARFAVQFRAAAFQSLAILENQEIDCVFCDFHDDYVVRRRNGSDCIYDFYQVKTKAKTNHQWSQLEVFSLIQKGVQNHQKINDSFAGKLLIHTVRFGKSCRSVVLQTNIQFDDKACSVVEALKNSDTNHAYAKIFFSDFGVIFPEAKSLSAPQIHECLQKFTLEPGSAITDISGDNFLALAKDAVYRYSEVELSYLEFVEIAEKLLSLVQKKSLQKISEVDEKSLVDAAGVTINDLLAILSISKAGYESLLKGGDSKALKTASILHRKLKEAGASDEIIDYLCRQKVLWDEWMRTRRHFLPEFEINLLMSTLYQSGKEWVTSGGVLEDLFRFAERLILSVNPILKPELNKDLLLGGILSEVARNQK